MTQHNPISYLGPSDYADLERVLLDPITNETVSLDPIATVTVSRRRWLADQVRLERERIELIMRGG